MLDAKMDGSGVDAPDESYTLLEVACMTLPLFESYREITLSKGQFALVDDCDYEEISKFTWHARWSNKTQSYYACRKICLPGRKLKSVEMARQILGLVEGDGLMSDHIQSGQTLDNRRSNIRVATAQENARNTRIRSNNTSGYKGVSWNSLNKNWRARIKVDGKYISLGQYKTAEEASANYAKAAEKYFGEFARV